jgi:hypothetical protein
MPLDFQKIDVLLTALDEGTASKRSLPGALDLCENATFPKSGRIDKRYGYALVPVGTLADGSALRPRNVFHGAFVAQGELVIVGHDWLFSLVDREGQIGDGALVRRGPTPRGNADVMGIITSQISDLQDDD